MTDDFVDLDVTAQAELVRRGEVQPVELVDAAIRRIERVDRRINAVITPLFEKARRAAVAPPDGPFRGVPFLLKDLDVYSAGDPYHAGSRFLRDLEWVADHDSYFVDKLRRAGLVFVGKTNTPELGLAVTTEPEAYGPSRNPWNTEHSTGGSSGGSGAAVAARLVAAAHASDGGGSIRIPASECGVVGLKPSRGRVSLGPDYGEYWHGLVISHVVTRTVRDCAGLLDVVAGAMPGDPYTAPASLRPFAAEVGAPQERLRVGFVTEVPSGVTRLHASCVTATRNAARALESLGHAVEASHPAALAEVEATGHFMTVITCWTAAAFAEWWAKTGREVGERDVEPTTWQFAALGRACPSARYIAAVESMHAWSRRMAEWWSDFDLLVTPTLGESPPRLGEMLPPQDNPLGTERALGLIPFTWPFNVTGQPAISLPLHWTDDGLPVGVQLVAASYREDMLLRVASQLEQAMPWRERRPPVCA
jgi:amidase